MQLKKAIVRKFKDHRMLIRNCGFVGWGQFEKNAFIHMVRLNLNPEYNEGLMSEYRKLFGECETNEAFEEILGLMESEPGLRKPLYGLFKRLFTKKEIV